MKKTLGVTLLVFLFPAPIQAQKLEFTNPDGLTKPTTYTQVVKAGKLLFISGQVGTTADGKVVGPGMREQTDQALANLATALKVHRADFSHIAKITTFVTSIPEYQSPEVRNIRAKHFGSNKPASTLVQIVQLAQPFYKVEIEAIVVLP